MKCTSLTKFPNSNTFTACGQCMPCRINRRKEWMTKLLLEKRYYGDNIAFITLTYAPENLPDAEHFKGGSLNKSDAQKFIKRFRMNYYYNHPDTEKKSIRYFLVGEYGTETSRAHYHAIIFGVDPHRAQKITKLSWTLGHSQCAEVKDGGIQYVCGYTLKKLTSEKDFPDGQQPEFSLKSTQPALGHCQIPTIARKLAQHNIAPALPSWDNWIAEQENISHEVFSGILGSKKNLRLDKPFMNKIKAFMLSETLDKVQEIDDKHIIYPKQFKIRQNRLQHDSYLAKMQDIRSGDAQETQKKAEKIFRRSTEKNTL